MKLIIDILDGLWLVAIGTFIGLIPILIIFWCYDWEWLGPPRKTMEIAQAFYPTTSYLGLEFCRVLLWVRKIP